MTKRRLSQIWNSFFDKAPKEVKKQVDLNQPHVKATNLYELCEQTADTIEAMPFNYYQDSWSCSAKVAYAADRGCDINEAPTEICGTAYCRAGWMHHILEQDAPQTLKFFQVQADAMQVIGGPGIFATMRVALVNAGIPDAEICSLFAGGSGVRGLMQGTPEYAEAGAEGVRKFMRRHAAKLKAVKL